MLCASVFGGAVPVANFPAGGYSGAVTLEDKVLFAGQGNLLIAYDVSEPLKPREIGRLAGFDDVRQIKVVDGFAYVVSRETGLRIADVRDPRQMRIRSLFDTVEFATGIEVAGNVAFVSERIYGVEAVDVRDKDHPRHIALRKTVESQSTVYHDGYLYSGDWGSAEITVFDARDMRSFRKLGTFGLGGFGDGVYVDGKYLYCSTGHDARHHRIATCGGDRVGAGRGLDIFDISDPASPRHVSRVDFPRFVPRDRDFWLPRVSNGTAYCCDSHNGLFAVDVREITKPAVLDRLCLPMRGKQKFPSACPSSLAIGEGCLYVMFSPGGLHVIPVNGLKPSIVHRQSVLPANADFADRYRTDDKKFHVYRPSAAGQARTAVVRGDIVYAAFGDAGLHVLKASDNGFEFLGTLPGGHHVTDCCFVGDRLVTAEGADGFALYELKGPAAFEEKARRTVTDGVRMAFWCWTTDDKSVLLSPRTRPYVVVNTDDFLAKKPLRFGVGGCMWNKYVADRAIDGRTALFGAYASFNTLDVRGKEPKLNRFKAGEVPAIAGQEGGICAFGDRFLYLSEAPKTDVYDYSVAINCYYVTPDCTFSAPVRLPAPAEDPGFKGAPRSDGRKVAVTRRATGEAAVYDFSDPLKPKLESFYRLSGRPDLAAFWHGRAIIPAGHQGLLMEKKPSAK